MSPKNESPYRYQLVFLLLFIYFQSLLYFHPCFLFLCLWWHPKGGRVWPPKGGPMQHGILLRLLEPWVNYLPRMSKYQVIVLARSLPLSLSHLHHHNPTLTYWNPLPAIEFRQKPSKWVSPSATNQAQSHNHTTTPTKSSSSATTSSWEQPPAAFFPNTLISFSSINLRILPHPTPHPHHHRRDPMKFHYSGTACPEFREGNYKKGNSCEFAHGVFECWLHPAHY